MKVYTIQLFLDMTLGCLLSLIVWNTKILNYNWSEASGKMQNTGKPLNVHMHYTHVHIHTCTAHRRRRSNWKPKQTNRAEGSLVHFLHPQRISSTAGEPCLGEGREGTNTWHHSSDIFQMRSMFMYPTHSTFGFGVTISIATVSN